MNSSQLITNPSKFKSKNWFSRVHCTWLYSLFLRGLKRDLDFRDLQQCPEEDFCEPLSNRFKALWEQEVVTSGSSASFTKVSLKAFLPKMIIPFILCFLTEAVFECGKAVLLGRVIRFFANPREESYLNACLCCAGVLIISLIIISLYQPAMLLGHRIAIKIRVSWCALIYQKSLRLKHSSLAKTTIGQILNLMSNDVSRLDEVFNYLAECSQLCSYLIVGPLNAIIGLIICWQYVQWTSLIGLAVLLCFIPLNSLMGRLFLLVRNKVAKLTDSRIKLMSEVIKGMRVIKMYGWEFHFHKIVSQARKKEMGKIRKSNFMRAFNSSISNITPRAIVFAIFVVYVSITGKLGAEEVFVTMTIFNNLRFTLSFAFTQSVALLAELYVSAKRIQRFLLLEEVDSKRPEVPANSDLSIVCDHVSAAWTDNCLTLKNIDLVLKKGETLAVVGKVGAGKSSFLMALLNEIPITSGSVLLNGRPAYAAQESWSFNASVLENVLFGQSYDSEKFKKVVDACALKRDLKALPFAEKTLVGERGVALSGGQKARLTLARALYSSADLYLLDDPLSAVDTEVANHIFDRCISTLLKEKTVVLVTHQLQFIERADKVLLLHEGCPLAFGTPEELKQKGFDFMALTSQKEKEEQKKQDDEEVKERSMSLVSHLSDASFAGEPQPEAEQKASGSISARVYWAYVRAGAGPFLLAVALVSTFISQGLWQYSDWWLSEWTNRDSLHYGNTTTDEKENIIFYTSLTVGSFIALIFRAFLWYQMCISSSIKLHDRIFLRVLTAKIAFFDLNPQGRILNRFTKDVGIVDEQLPGTSYDLNMILTQLIGSLLLVATVNPYLLIPASFLLFLIIVIRWAYLKTGRDLKRFEGIARSPIYNHVTTTLSGLATIRAFRAQQLFKEQYFRFQDDHTSTYFLNVAASRALGITMDWLCWLYVLTVALVIMILFEGLPPGSAGLALSLALGLTGMTQWGVRQSAELENQMTSVERIVQYSQLDSESNFENPEIDLDSNWPEKGSIRFSKVFLTYSNAVKPTLRNLNFEIRGGEKVGVVGRTGAGKSSLLAALFRLHETDGVIYIDDLDIRSLGLHQLRKRISVIPQDPVAFIGSLRENLDPFLERKDEELWSALEEVQLKEAVLQMDGQLEHELAEGGTNLSVGQRQLICLARAILRRNKILVLDEATANVDLKTDQLIQATIRTKFQKCTVLTVAHRLNTVIDSDRILVLDNGQVVEFDRPIKLLQNKGFFYKLVQKTGHEMARELIARVEHQERQSQQYLTIDY